MLTAAMSCSVEVVYHLADLRPFFCAATPDNVFGSFYRFSFCCYQRERHSVQVCASAATRHSTDRFFPFLQNKKIKVLAEGVDTQEVYNPARFTQAECREKVRFWARYFGRLLSMIIWQRSI